MASRRRLSLVLVLSLVANALASPAVARPRRLVGYADNELGSSEEFTGVSSSTVMADPAPTLPPTINKSYDEMKKVYEAPQTVPLDEDDDDDDDFESMDYAPSNSGGSNLLSLLNLGSSLLGGSSGANNVLVRRMIRSFIRQYMAGGIRFDFPINKRRMDTNINEIDTDFADQLSKPSKQQEKETKTNNAVKDGNPSILNSLRIETKSKSAEKDHAKHDRQKFKVEEIHTDYADLPLEPPKFERQETDEEDDSSEDSNDSSESDEDTNNAAEESLEEQDNEPKADASNASNASAGESDYDSDEPPGGGDGQGGGVLGLLAGLSGGEDGQSDLGSLLAAVSGIVANLSGDGFDLNALIASGLGLFVGLLSEGEENPGAVISSYLLTSLDTITGGGAKNNGEFLGTFLSKLIKGTSAGGDPDASSEENGGAMPMADSAGFFLSFLMGLSGDMSKGSSGSSSHSSW